MDNQYKAVPDGQYTQTIYSLIRDQKYNEVSNTSIISHSFRYPFHTNSKC